MLLLCNGRTDLLKNLGLIGSSSIIVCCRNWISSLIEPEEKKRNRLIEECQIEALFVDIGKSCGRVSDKIFKIEVRVKSKLKSK